MPFASLAFTGFFPASINLYWFTLAGYQLFTTQLMYVSYIRRKLGSSADAPAQRTLRFDSAVIVEEKASSEEAMSAAEKIRPMNVD